MTVKASMAEGGQVERVDDGISCTAGQDTNTQEELHTSATSNLFG